MANITAILSLSSTSFNQAYSEYKHVLANILRLRYVARTPPLEAHSPGRHSNVENASVTRRSLISNARAPHVNKGSRYVAIATQLVQRLQMRPIVHN